MKKDQSKRAAAAAFMGTTIEFYDFYVYATAAALILGTVFFPKTDPVTGTLASFATLAVGFIARPMAGLIFGHLGDRLGRKNAAIYYGAHGAGHDLYWPHPKLCKHWNLGTDFVDFLSFFTRDFGRGRVGWRSADGQ